MTFKLTAKQRALAVYAVAQRFAHLRQQHRSEPPEVTLGRAAAEIAQERPNDQAHAIARLALGRVKTKRGNGIVRWSDRTLDPRTWKRREAACDAARAYLADLLAAQPAQPQAPTTPPVRVNVIGTRDAQGATVQASSNPLEDGANVVRLVNAKLDSQPQEQRIEYVDPLAAGHGEESIDYTGEPLVRAALVDALRERRRGRTLRCLDSGELDLSRVVPTALGVDLERAYSRRIRPDVRGVAVWIALDGSTSMNEGYPSRWTCAQRAAAMAMRGLERERITTAGEIYGHREHVPSNSNKSGSTPLRAFGAPIGPALQHLARFRPCYGTDAPGACARGAAALATRHEPRRVLMFLCDEDVRATDPAWTDAARAGIEIWPLLVGADAERGAAAIAAQTWAAIPPIVVVDPSELVARWTRALREHLGRVNA